MLHIIRAPLNQVMLQVIPLWMWLRLLFILPCQSIHPSFSLFSSYFHSFIPSFYFPQMPFLLSFFCPWLFLSSASLPVALELLSIPKQLRMHICGGQVWAQGNPSYLEVWPHLCPQTLLICFGFSSSEMAKLTPLSSQWMKSEIWIKICFLSILKLKWPKQPE